MNLTAMEHSSKLEKHDDVHEEPLQMGRGGQAPPDDSALPFIKLMNMTQTALYEHEHEANM